MTNLRNLSEILAECGFQIISDSYVWHLALPVALPQLQDSADWWKKDRQGCLSHYFTAIVTAGLMGLV